MSDTSQPYKHLGVLSSAPIERSIALRCHKCRVTWIGCQDAPACPRCGDTADYESYLERRDIRERITKTNQGEWELIENEVWVGRTDGVNKWYYRDYLAAEVSP